MKKGISFSFLVTLKSSKCSGGDEDEVSGTKTQLELSANNGVALRDITHGRFPIAVCFSTHFESYKLDFSPFWEAH